MSSTENPYSSPSLESTPGGVSGRPRRLGAGVACGVLFGVIYGTTVGAIAMGLSALLHSVFCGIPNFGPFADDQVQFIAHLTSDLLIGGVLGGVVGATTGVLTGFGVWWCGEPEHRHICRANLVCWTLAGFGFGGLSMMPLWWSRVPFSLFWILSDAILCAVLSAVAARRLNRILSSAVFPAVPPTDGQDAAGHSETTHRDAGTNANPSP